jgi:hypothetical protein
MGYESLDDFPYPPNAPACDHIWKEVSREPIGWDGGGPGPGSGKGDFWYAVIEECTKCHETQRRETT